MATSAAARVLPVAADVHAYARDVAEGHITAGPHVRKAAERHLRDLVEGGARGLRFDEKKAERALRFISLLNLEEDTPFDLEPFQVFIVGSLFGWYSGEHRRFRRAYIEMGKGNGKTPLGAAIALYGMIAEGIPRAECYSAATTSPQAHIAFEDAKAIVRSTPELAGRVRSLEHNLSFRHSFFRPFSSDGARRSGPRPHIAIVDELHEHPDDGVIELLRAGTKRDLDALILAFTNSGASRNSVCWDDHQYSINVLDGVFDDDGWFAYVCALDEGDDWRDELVWLKANPGLGTILPVEYLREQIREASGKPSKENLVKRLNCCIWTEQLERWLVMEAWDACGAPIDREALAGRRCFAGLDLSSRTDFSAVTLLFPPEDDEEGEYIVLPFFFLPEQMIRRTRRERRDIAKWAAAGLVELTPGNTIDHGRIRDVILDLSTHYQIEEIAHDPWNSTQLATQLAESGATMVEVRQSAAHMSEPSKELEALTLSQRLRHGGHELLRWMASNVAVREDLNGNIRPDRDRSGDKIDGIVTTIMALGRAIVHRDVEPEESVYERRGVRRLT